MKTTQKLTFLFILATFIFAGCEKNEKLETIKNSNLTSPTEEESQLAKNTLPKIDGWNGVEKSNADFKTLKSGTAGQYFQISGKYWDEGTFSVSGNLYVTGCVGGTDVQATVVYWLYNYTTQKWKMAQQVSGVCMDEDNLNSFHTYYGNTDVENKDCYIIVAAQVYILDVWGSNRLWDTFYSNVTFLDWPF
jgi:hypothetical protein